MGSARSWVVHAVQLAICMALKTTSLILKVVEPPGVLHVPGLAAVRVAADVRMGFGPFPVSLLLGILDRYPLVKRGGSVQPQGPKVGEVAMAALVHMLPAALDEVDGACRVVRVCCR